MEKQGTVIKSLSIWTYINPGHGVQKHIVQNHRKSNRWTESYLKECVTQPITFGNSSVARYRKFKLKKRQDLKIFWCKLDGALKPVKRIWLVEIAPFLPQHSENIWAPKEGEKPPKRGTISRLWISVKQWINFGIRMSLSTGMEQDPLVFAHSPCSWPAFCLWENFHQYMCLIRELRKCRNKEKQSKETK